MLGHHNSSGNRGNGNNSSLASLPGTPSVSANRGPGSTLGCNRCRKPIATTLFVCSCDCVFCEECTYSHFNENSKCPSCGKDLDVKDFMELVVADPSSVSEETLKNSFQSLFTKFSTSSNSISYHELCLRLLKSFDNERRIIKFVLKQFVADGNNVRNRSGNMMRELERLKKENTQLKQGSNSQRIQFDQTTADLQHRVQALNATVQELQKKLNEKDIQISQFRQICANEGMARLPSAGSSSSVGSGGRNRNGNMDADGYYTSRSPMNMISVSSNAPLPLPPMQGFVLAKQAREQAKAQALGDMSRSRVILPQSNNVVNGSGGRMQHGRRMDDVNSVITPIQIPNHGNNRMISSSLSPMNIGVGGAGPNVANTPRIRDLSASSGYAFTTRSNIHSNNGIGGGKRDRSHSPSIPNHQQFGFSSANNGHRGGNHRY